VPTGEKLWDAYFNSEQRGWVVGANGTILGTDSGGVAGHAQTFKVNLMATIERCNLSMTAGVGLPESRGAALFA